MSIYFWVVATIVLIGLVFGFLGPTLISAGSSEAVLLGFALVIVFGPILFLFIKKILKEAVIKKEIKDEENV